MKIIKIISGIIVVAIVVLIAVLLFKSVFNKVTSSKFIYMGNAANLNELNGKAILTSYDDYNKVFGVGGKISEDDFKNNNYVLIHLNYDSCAEDNVRPVSLEVSKSRIRVEVKYRRECGGCAPMNDYYLAKVDKNVTDAVVSINYTATNDPKCDPTVSYKPLIYLYPTEETNVKVKLGMPDNLTVTYPKYNGEWNVNAKPNGVLTDNNGREYYGLYWEGVNSIKEDYKDGFVVEKKDLIPFLEEKLAILGLNEREADEFIIYWLPQLEKNKYNLIRFADLETINEQMPLYVEPKPDTIIRVLMEYKPLDKKIKIPEQKLETTSRYGFSVVEWGGTKIN